MSDTKNIFIKGKNIFLRDLNLNDIKGNYKYWLNDPETNQYNSHGKFPYSISALKKYVERVTNQNDCIVLAIIELKSSLHIGNISLQSINWLDRNCEIAFLLGDKKYRSKGIMREAGMLLIDHAFNKLNIHRIYCGTSSENIGMQKLALKLGMKKEGTRKDAIFNNGKFHDVIEFGVIKSHEIL